MAFAILRRVVRTALSHERPNGLGHASLLCGAHRDLQPAMERSGMRELPSWRITPDFAMLHPGYGLLRATDGCRTLYRTHVRRLRGVLCGPEACVWHLIRINRIIVMRQGSCNDYDRRNLLGSEADR